MRDIELLAELLRAEDEDSVLDVLSKRKLLDDLTRWKYLGNMPNNQSVVHNQQSTAAAALIEKYTNAVDAILIRHCKARGMDPRGTEAHSKWPTMAQAVDAVFPSLSSATDAAIRSAAAENIVLYATGRKERPCISLFDAGEGQLAKDFPNTFCSLIHADSSGSYKGAIPFVQGRFNMGGTGVLPFCSEKRKLQLVVSRVPLDISPDALHEWAFTLMCFFPGRENSSWRYLVGADGNVLTAGTDALGLLPVARPPKNNEALPPRERTVTSGTLIKMYDFKAPKSNVCGELYKQLKQFLLRPALPLRIIECRAAYAAKIMAVTMWDVMEAWKRDKILEAGFEDGAGVTVTLSTGEQIPAEIRVFTAKTTNRKGQSVDLDVPITGVRAIINGQSHARRGDDFFKTKAVDKEHIAGSMLVTLDCTELGQGSRNALFMSNRETFREDPLLVELLNKLRRELHDHEMLELLNARRYEEKLKDAVENEDGLDALEELLSTDPSLASLFGSATAGRIAAQNANSSRGGKVPGIPPPFKGVDYPTYFKRANGATSVKVDIPQGDSARASFLTDVKSNYFTRKRPARGHVAFSGSLLPEPTYRLFNGRLTFTMSADKKAVIGTQLAKVAVISDSSKPQPFVLTIDAVVVNPRSPVSAEKKPKSKREPRVDSGPSRPAVKEQQNGPDEPPLTVERDAKTRGLVIVVNTTSRYLEQALANNTPENEPAVRFVYTYGLALVAMGLIDKERTHPEWTDNEAACRERIAATASGVARVIVPLCLSLPKNLPRLT